MSRKYRRSPLGGGVGISGGRRGEDPARQPDAADSERRRNRTSRHRSLGPTGRHQSDVELLGRLRGRNRSLLQRRDVEPTGVKRTQRAPCPRPRCSGTPHRAGCLPTRCAALRSPRSAGRRPDRARCGAFPNRSDRLVRSKKHACPCTQDLVANSIDPHRVSSAPRPGSAARRSRASPSSSRARARPGRRVRTSGAPITLRLYTHVLPGEPERARDHARRLPGLALG